MQLTDWRAKPAVPFGGKFRIIDFTLSNCVNAGVRRIGVATQYRATSLIQHLLRAWTFLDGRFDEFVQLLPAQQQAAHSWYRGTADAVLQNLPVAYRCGPEFIFIFAADHVYKMDYGRMLAAHVERRADLTIACVGVPAGEAGAFGIIGIDNDQRISRFWEKPRDSTQLPRSDGKVLASMGVYVFNARVLYDELIRDAADATSSHDFGRDIIPSLVSRRRVFAHHFADSCVGAPHGEPYWRDVGTVDAYWEANLELTKVLPELDLYDESWPIWTYQEQLPAAKFVFDDDSKRGYAVDSLVSGGCIISGSAVRRTLLFSRVRVQEQASVEDSVILPGVEIGPGALVRRAVLDKRCVIPPDMQIGVDDAEDHRRFHVTKGGVVLVTPDMLGQDLRSESRLRTDGASPR